MFNPHENCTAEGVIITMGLRVFTNELRIGEVILDADADRCCGDGPDAGRAQKYEPFMGAWFSDHESANVIVAAGHACRHDHWFTIKLDDGGQSRMNGERLATVFQGRKA
jgi:hypothetical protein